MKELLRNEKYMYVLEEEDNGSLFFTVTCGGVGMYDLKIEMNEAEKECYRELGEEYLNKLAYQIRKDTSAYMVRVKL